MSKRLEIKKWDKYNRLTIIKEVEKLWIHRRFLCKCDCWVQKKVLSTNLNAWKVKSCGCYSAELRITHWMGYSRIYNTRKGVINRCYRENNPHYKNYGWRGIKVEWERFEEFHEDMKEWYSDELTIERINNNWNYSKENCRWATRKEQARNRSTNVLYKWKCISQWCEELGISRFKLNKKISKGII